MNKYAIGDGIEKITSIFSFASIFIALSLVLKNVSVNVSTISIYAVYPSYFWLLLVAPIALLLFSLIFGKQSGHSIFYIYVNIFTAVFSLLIILSLPIVQGFQFYGEGDVYNHLGWIKEILSTGHFTSFSNPYPGIHVLITILSDISSLSPETISLYVPQIFIFVYIMFMFLLSRSLKCNLKQSLFITSFAIVPVLGYWLTIDYIMPSTEAFFLIPMVLYCIIKSRISDNAISFVVLSIPLLILFPLIHLEASLFLLIILIILYIIPKIKVITSKMSDVNDSFIMNRRNSLIPALILLISFSVWFMLISNFNNTVVTLHQQIIYGLVPDSLPNAALSGGLGLTLSDALELLVVVYGHALIYLAIGGFICILTIIKIFANKKVLFRDIFLACLFLTFISINFIFLKIPTSISVDIYRQFKYSIFVATIILGGFFGDYFSYKYNISFIKQVISFLFIIIFVIIVPLLAIYSIYSTPLIMANPQNHVQSQWGKPVFSSSLNTPLYAFTYQPTISDISGIKSFFTFRNSNLPILELFLAGHQYHFVLYLYGTDSSIKSNVQYGTSLSMIPPAHFGYDQNRTLGGYYREDQYLLDYPSSNYINQKVYSSSDNSWQWHYSPNDFEMLNQDSTVKLIYNNGNFKVFSIHGLNT